MIKISPIVKEMYPGFVFGIMTAHGIDTSSDRAAMEALKERELEKVRVKYSGYDRKAFIESDPIRQYCAYYRKFNKTYHVLLQLESIVMKNKGIPGVGIAVEAMFLAEVKNQLLTAAHDMEMINGQLTLGVAAGSESFTDISGKTQQLTKGDLFLGDETGVLSSILCGPDYRTRITESSKSALYFVYGVDGVSGLQINKHLVNIASYLQEVNRNVRCQII